MSEWGVALIDFTMQHHAVNRIVGPNETITSEKVRDWCAKLRP
jgi:hypothetical protein